MPTSPEELAPGVIRIDAIGFSNAINVWVVAGDDGWTLVDTGMAGSAKRIQAALTGLGVGPDALARIYLTHHHSDHIGGLPRMLEWAPGAEVVAPEHEAEIIAGKLPPDPSYSGALRMMQRWSKLPQVPVTRIVGEGANVAGLRVIATPGHTLGHTSLISDDKGLLLTADAFGALPRRLRVGVRKAFCADPSQARRSAEKLIHEEYSTVSFSHGRTLRESPKERLREIVAGCGY